MSDDIHTPRRIGPYEVLVPIGTGGMASVFLGRVQVVDDVYRPVALKFLHPFLASEPNVENELLDEARIAASIRHPNVVGVLGVVREGTSLALVLEYIEGESVAGILGAFAASNCQLPLNVGLRIVVDALEGLHGAHELRDASGALINLVHRDFSPQNLLVGIDGRTRLTDFGIAKAAKRSTHTRTGIIKGKISYMAPEHVLGMPLDRRADVWAAGAVAWEIFAREKLQPSDDDVAMMLRIAQQPPRAFHALRPDLPLAFTDAVQSALARDRDQRCATALELRTQLLEAAPVAPADHAEVGALVRKLFEQRLDTRRQRMERAITERSQAVLRSSAEPGEEVSVNVETSSVSLVPAAPRSSRTWSVAVLAIVAVAGFATVAWQNWRTAPASSARASAPTPAPTQSAAPVATSRAPTPARRVRLEADAPMRIVEIGSRKILLQPPVTETRIELDELDSALVVRVTGNDGRVATLTLERGTSEVVIKFPARPRPRTPAPRASSELLPIP